MQISTGVDNILDVISLDRNIFIKWMSNCNCENKNLCNGESRKLTGRIVCVMCAYVYACTCTCKCVFWDVERGTQMHISIVRQ